MSIRKTPEQYHLLAQRRGLEWLGPESQRTAAKTEWRCGRGHRWMATYDGIAGGRGCPICGGTVRRTPVDYHETAKKYGFCWLGPEVPNGKTKTNWRCGQGHIWQTIYFCIQQGYGCPACAKRVLKTSQEIHELASAHGFLWVGPEIKRSSDKTGWMCNKGHTWKATYLQIRRGRGCPTCNNEQKSIRYRLSLDDYHRLAQEKGFIWLGPEVKNILTGTNWQCPQGHIWKARYGNIYSGRGCPTCVDRVNGASVSKLQRKLCSMVNGELNRPFGRFTIDVVLNIEGIDIAIEYDSFFWHAEKNERDTRKNEALIEAGWRVLRIKTDRLLPSLEQVNGAITRLLLGESLVEIVLDDWPNETH